MVGVEGGRWSTGTIFRTMWASGRRAEVRFRVAGVDAEGVAVPEIDGGVGDGSAGAHVEDSEAEMERNAGEVLGDVGAEQFVGDVERADLLLRSERAGWM